MTAAVTYDFLVALVVELPGIVVKDPFAIGPFEVTTRIDSLPNCRASLEASWKDHGHAQVADLGAAGIRLIKAFFNGVPSEFEAVKSARLHAQEALALWNSSHFGMLDAPVLTGAGYTLNLRGGHAAPINRPFPMHRAAGTLAIIDEVGHHPDLTINNLLSVHPSIYGELGQAVRRSTHWSHLATTVDDWTERFLLSWMAAETLSRVSQVDNLDGRWLATLGFPSGRAARQFRADDARALGAIPGYRQWRKRLQRCLVHARGTRNAIVHAGYRELDIEAQLGDEDRLLLTRLFRLLVPRLRSLALSALSRRITSIKEMWRRFGDCFYLHRQVPLASEVEGTIIYTLEQPRGRWDE